MKFSEYLIEIDNIDLKDDVEAHFNMLQDTGMLQTTILLSGQVALTEHYLNYEKYLESEGNKNGETI